MPVIALSFFVILFLAVPLEARAAEPPQTSPLLAGPQRAAMAESFKSGRLPAALPIPSGQSDAAIKTLVAQIAAKDKQSTAALLTAMQLAGYTIMDDAGHKVVAPSDGKGQGMALAAWEMATTAKMFGEGRRMSLLELSDKLRVAVPQLAQIDLPTLLIEEIKTNYFTEERPFLRAWARLIVELGLRAPEPYDLFLNPRPDRVMLDPIQTELILYRLVGDFYAYSERAKARSSSSGWAPLPDSLPMAAGRVSFVSPSTASYSARPMLVANQGGSGTATGPCKLDQKALTILDGTATIIGAGAGSFLGVLQGAFGAAGEKWIGGYSKILGATNIILAYAKFIQTYASLEIELSAEEGTLVRTKNARPGAQKKLQAHVVLDIGNWEMYNCLRLAILTATGIDFSTMADGPVKAVWVTWHLDEGGAGDASSNQTGLTGKEQFVGYTGDNPSRPRIQDPGTKAGSGGTGVQVGSAALTKTNDAGVATNTLEGTPQKNAKLGKLVEVHKQALVRVTVALKGRDLVPDMVDVMGSTLPLIGGISAIIQLPLELLYSASWASSDQLTVPVIDWEECTGGWKGTVTYTDTMNITDEQRVLSAGGGVTNRKNTVRNSYSGTISINDGTATATATMSSMTRGDEYAIRYGKCHSYDRVKPLLSDGWSVVTVEGSGTKTTTVDSKDGRGLPPLGLPEMEASSQLSQGGTRSCTTDNPPPVLHPPVKTKMQGRSVQLEGAQPDPDDPNRMHGNKTYNIGSNGKTTITWDLARCTDMR